MKKRVTVIIVGERVRNRRVIGVFSVSEWSVVVQADPDDAAVARCVGLWDGVGHRVL